MNDAEPLYQIIQAVAAEERWGFKDVEVYGWEQIITGGAKND